MATERLAAPPTAAAERHEYDDLTQILFTEEQIARRVAELGEQISSDYQGSNLVIVGVLKGVIIFLADLLRELKSPVEFDVVGAQSYKGGSKPTSEVNITKDLDVNVQGRDVLLLEDIYDTGKTLHVVHDMVMLYKPKSIQTCALLRKNLSRPRVLPIKYVGFEIDDVFVVGYGLDYKERYRNLPCIGVLNPEIYT